MHIGVKLVVADRLEMPDQLSGQVHQSARGHYLRDVVEGPLPADVGRLLLLVQFTHVDTVAGNVVCGSAETDDAQQRDGDDEELRQTQGKRYAAKGDTRHQLSGNNPKLLGAKQFEERTPQRFQRVGQQDEGSPQRGERFVDTHSVEHQNGDHVEHNEGKSHGKVGSGHPCNRRAARLQFIVFHEGVKI